MKKKKIIIISVFFSLAFLLTAYLMVYRYVGVGGKVVKIDVNEAKGFYSEYYLFIPDTYKEKESTFLLVEPNNTGFVEDDHKKHMAAAHDLIRFGQANFLAKRLGVPLLVPCFDRTETNWETYTHALDRETLLLNEGPLSRIDKQLLAMVADAGTVLREQKIEIKDKILLNGFSASGSFANRFTALHPEKVAGTAAGGINGMLILPASEMEGQKLIYPVGISDVEEIADIAFQAQQFASVPQYYYMGEKDDNDALPYDDAYSGTEREIILRVLGEDMSARWESCKRLYESKGVRAEFHTVQGAGHETTGEINENVAAFFMKIMEEQESFL